MKVFVDSILSYFQTLSWENPATYLFIVLICLAVLKKWSILILVFLTFFLASIANDMIVMNLQTAKIVVSVPFAIYCIGGFVILIIAIIGFIKFMLE
jgi:hypothetical protein